jgi:hypothetical protein
MSLLRSPMFPKRQQKAVERATSVWRQRHKTAAAGNAQRQAFALVLILPILALLLVLVITILQSSLGGRRAARTEQDVSSSQALAEIATNLVFRQIRAASSQSDDVTESHTWASQPAPSGVMRWMAPRKKSTSSIPPPNWLSLMNNPGPRPTTRRLEKRRNERAVCGHERTVCHWFVRKVSHCRSQGRWCHRWI